jgi:putative salt-induced outer membrane protein
MTLNRFHRFVLGTSLVVAAGAAHADWQGKGEAGVVLASGNTETRTLDGKLNLADTWDAWKEIIDLSYLKASSAGTDTADRFLASSQTNYALNDRAFWFGGLEYQHDKFSGFQFQESATTGLGYKFVDTATNKFSGQVGIGARRLKNDVTGADSSGAVWTVGLNYENALTATTKVVDKLAVEGGSANTQIHNFLGLEVKMSTALALSLGYDVMHNSEAPPPRKATDQLITANLVFAF